MPQPEWAIKNARIVTRHEVIRGGATIAGGRIESIDEGSYPARGALDFEGDYLLPGLVELHTDNLEERLSPRPGVIWSSGMAAILSHDLLMIGSGITTVLDAITIGDYVGTDSDKKFRSEMLPLAAGSVKHAIDAGVLRAEHFLHYRCEVSDTDFAERFTQYMPDERVKLLSVMDHTPGDRQYTDVNQFTAYYRNRNWTEDETKDLILNKKAVRNHCAAANRGLVVKMAKKHGIAAASHDDTTAEQARETAEDGMGISEFPTTMAAADAARQLGLKVVMGAPNVVRDGSHSGNVSAADLAKAGLLDILSSDYYPASLLHAAFVLYKNHGLSLTDSVAMVSDTPARAVGLGDRGRLEQGLLADMARVRLVDGYPVTVSVWRRGRQVA